MYKHTKSTHRDLNIEELEKAQHADVYSIESLLVTVKRGEILATLPEWMANYPIPPGTIACPEDPFACYSKLIKIQREKGICVHPVNHIDTLLLDNNVTVSTTGVSIKKDEEVVTIQAVCGYLLNEQDDVERLCHASTADIVVTDAKLTKDRRVMAVDWPKNFEVPNSDAVKYRHMCGSDTPGRSKPREEIFAFLSKESNSLVGIRLHTLIGLKLKNFSSVVGLDDEIKKVYEQRGSVVPRNFCTKVISIQNGAMPYTEDIADAYRFYFKSIGLRGGREGKNVAHGFERFSMSRSNAHMLNLVLDMKQLASRYKSTTIISRNETFTNEEMRVLVANGLSIICPNTPFPEQLDLTIPGVYGKYKKEANPWEFFKMSEDWIKPELLNQKEYEGAVKFGMYYDSAITLITQRPRCASYIYMDDRLSTYEGKMSLLPSATADTLKVIIASGVKTTMKLKDLVARGTVAISCRNRYVHNRKPFCSMDSMGREVGWSVNIVLPRIKCKEKNKKYVEPQLFHQEEVFDVEAPTFDLGKLKNKVAQLISEETTAYSVLVDAYGYDKPYLMKIIAGIEEGKPFKYIGPDQSWNDKFGMVLDVGIKELKTMLESCNVRALEEYKEIYDEIYIEEVPLEFPVKRDPIPTKVPDPIIAMPRMGGGIGLRCNLGDRVRSNKNVKKEKEEKKKKKKEDSEEEASVTDEDTK